MARVSKKVAEQAEKAIRDEKGFYVTEPSDNGKKRIEEMTRNLPDMQSPILLDPPKAWDIGRIRKIIVKSINSAKHGRFEHGAKLKRTKSDSDSDLRESRRQFHSFVDSIIDNGTIPSDSLDLVIQIIRIGKTYYEFADPDLQEAFIDNSRYDGLLAVLKKIGGIEPAAYTPEEEEPKPEKEKKKSEPKSSKKGSEEAKASKPSKVEVKDSEYSILAINTDKCYIIHKDDKVPTGVQEKDSVEAWLTRCYKNLQLDPDDDEVKLVITPKLDGVALRGEINTKNRLIDPMMRGDKDTSIVVTGLSGLRLSDEDPIADYPFGCQFEAFVTYQNVGKASDCVGNDKPYASPRHAASGLVNRLRTKQDGDMAHLLCFYPINSDGLEGSYVENLEKIQVLGKCPDDIIEPKTIEGTMSSLLKQIRKCFKEAGDIRPTLSYPIDGLVISFAEREHQSEIGRIGRTNKWQIALKFDPESAVGVADRIELSPGKKGFRTIQLYLKNPVVIEGVRYDHVMIGSADIFDKLDICKGDKVRVHRTGDVIPTISIESRSDGGKKIRLPEKCPSCGKALIREAKKLKCTNADCDANLVGRLLTFFDVAKIDGIGDAIAANLVEAGFRTVIDIIEADVDDDRFEKAGLSETRAKGLQEDILNAFDRMRDYEVIAAMGIPGVGIANAKKIVEENVDAFERFRRDGSINSLVHNKMFNESYTLQQADAIGAILYELPTYFKYMKNFTSKDEFDSMGLVGHTGFTPSQELRDFVREIGWDLVDGKKCDCLIVPSHQHNSAKTEYAQKRGIKIYTEAEFIKAISDRDPKELRYTPRSSFGAGLFGRWL